MSNPSQYSTSFSVNYLPSGIEHVDEATYVITHQVETSGIPVMRSLNQVEELKLIIRQMEQERNHIIESQVLKALKSQEEQFNIFYQENIRKVEEHFETQIIPQRIKAVENQFYKHQPVSTVTQVSSSSVMMVPNEATGTLRSINVNDEAYLHEKYEEWKVTYLPVILELKEKEWIERYEAVELQNILKKKYQEWESIRLLSIMKEQRNKWILGELFAQRQSQLNRNFEQLIKVKIHEVEQYWQQVLSQRISAQLTQWNANQQGIMRAKIHEVEQYWQEVIVPQRIQQWSVEHGTNAISKLTSSETITYTAADLDRILAEEHHKWQLQSNTQFQSRLQSQLKVRLQSQLRIRIQSELHINLQSQRKHWQLTVLPQLRQQLQKEYHSTHVLTTKLDTSKIDQIINAKYQEWKHTYLPEYLRLEKSKWLQDYTKNQLQILLRKKQLEWQSLRLLAIVRETRNHWVIEAILKEKLPQLENAIIIRETKKWESILIEKTREWQLMQETMRREWEVQQQKQRNIWLQTILIEQQHNWENNYLITHPQQKQVVVKEVVKQVDIQSQLHRHELLWKEQHQLLLKNQLLQAQKYWTNIFEQEKLNFQQTLESALQVRTSQIQTYWQQVMLPQIKVQWESEHSQVVKLQTTPESQEEKIATRVNAILQVETEKRIDEWLRVQLPLILEQKRQEWHVNYTHTEQFKVYLLNQQNLWVQQVEQEYQKRLHDQQLHFEHQIQTIRSQSNFNISELERTLSARQAQYRSLQTKLLSVQKSLTQHKQPVESSINTKQVIQKLKIDHQNIIHQLKLSYEQKISQLNHQKSLFMIQIKQLQVSLQNTHNISQRPKESVNMTVIQANFDKQILSLQATIKTKESQVMFLKRSIDTLTLENQQLNTRVISVNGKLASLQSQLDQARNNSIKLDYQIKYLKEKESSFMKKLQNKDSQFNEMKSRLQFEKSLLQKKLREHSLSSQNLSALQLKINQYESQLSIKHSSIKTLQNDIQRKKRQLEQQKQRSASYIRDIEAQKSTIKQYELMIQDLRLEIRKSCDEINRQKLMIEAGEQKEKSYIQQIRKIQLRVKNNSHSQQLIRQNQRLKLQISKLRQRLTQIEYKQSLQIYRLKQAILSLETRLHSTNVNFRQGDITQIQILKRINHEISDLVSSNKQLQMRIIVLENEKQLSAFGISIERFFVAFQEQMDHLVNYLMTGDVWSADSINLYHKFEHKARETLSHGYIEDYFRQWQTMMRGLIEQNHQKTLGAARMGTMTNNHNLVKDEETDEIIDKYDAVLNDVKFTLLEFIKTGDEEYLQLMSKSLGIEVREGETLKINGASYK